MGLITFPLLVWGYSSTRKFIVSVLNSLVQLSHNLIVNESDYFDCAGFTLISVLLL